ncbi:MAG: hypothetical protein SFZ03_00930 [Candidatus Melainabacteria bacterium]|nr:hypothetical protein [Candidatus Melainabacteria bacterium]
MAATGFVLSIVGGFSGKAEKEKMLQRQWEHKQKLASLPKTPETPEPPPHIQKAIAQEVMDKVRQAGEPTRPIQKAQPLTPNPPTEAVEPVVKSPTSTVTTAKDSTKASATEPPPTPAAITPHNLTPQQVLENWSNSQLSLLLVDRQNYTEEQRLEWLKGRLEHFGIPYCAEFDTGLKRRDKQ